MLQSIWHVVKIRGLKCASGLQYIYVTLEEMDAIAAHIQEKGRISIAQLARDVSRIIGMHTAQPRAQPEDGSETAAAS